MPSPTAPDWTLTIAGSPVDPPAARIFLQSLTPYDRDGDSTLEWVVPAVAVVRPDPYLGKRVTLSYDAGSGDVLAFDGEVVSAPWAWSEHGWARHYTARGGRFLGDLVPHTDPNTGGDLTAFNLDPDDPEYVASRAGRTVGQILLAAFGYPANASALDALGIGNYSSYGTGAGATATLAGGGGLTIAVDDGGSDYDTGDGDPPVAYLLGGDGTYTSTSVSVSGGAVTSIGVTGATGYTVAPQVIISTLPLDTVRDFAALALIPPTQVYFQGERLLGAGEGVSKPWAPNHALYVPADGTIRLLDQRLFGSGSGTYPAAVTLTMNDPDDLVDVPGVEISPETGGCFTRVVVRGGPEIELMLLSLAAGDLEELFAHDGLDNADAKDAWKLSDFEQPETVGSVDQGSCSCTSTTEVEVDPADNARTWASNFWDQTTSGRKGVIYLSYSAGSGITTHVARKIIANDALSAAGTATITVDRPLPHTDFDTYTIIGKSGSASIVWRRYGITDADKAVRVQSQFPYPVPIVSANDNAVTLSSFGIVRILWSEDDNPPFFEVPAGFDIDRDAGTIDLVRPSVTWFGTQENLETGGASTDGIPSDVQALLPISVGALTAVCPADAGSPAAPQFDGTALDDYGIERTLHVTAPNWRDPSNRENMETYACDLLDSVKDTVLEGTIPLRRFDARFLTPGNSARLAGSGYTTDYEGVDLPVVGCVLRFPGKGSPDLYRTELRVSTRRAAFEGSVYERPRPIGFQFGTDGETFNAGGPGS